MIQGGRDFSWGQGDIAKKWQEKERIMILIKRRDLLVGLTGFGLYSTSGCKAEGSYTKNPDDLPEQAFYLVGNIEEVKAKAEKIKSEK